MYEVEVKVRADLDDVRASLDAIDARHRETVEQTDTYFDAPHRDFAERDEALRLRNERRGDTASHTLTFKGPKVDETSKTRREVETAVGDPDALESILESLGYSPVGTVRKERERYEVGKYTVSLDSVAEVGSFVEVETETDEGAGGTAASEEKIENARDGAFDLLERLGLDPNATIRTSYLELLLREGRES
ncbi:MAG: class IV adenylate cyclase [Halodesulfurarchaeum sp.]